MQKKGNRYGSHRVIEPKGVLTQAAYRIDNNMDEIYSNEILVQIAVMAALIFSVYAQSFAYFAPQPSPSEAPEEI